jgi:hypothetical protein
MLVRARHQKSIDAAALQFGAQGGKARGGRDGIFQAVAGGGELQAGLDQRRPGFVVQRFPDQRQPLRPREPLRRGRDPGQKRRQIFGRNRLALAFQPGGEMADTVVG